MRAKTKMPGLEDLRLFDSCVTLGRIVHSAVPEYLTRENILQVMDKYEIAEALVHDNHARLTYPREDGNRRLMNTIKGMPRLHPVWVLEPPKRIGKKASSDVVNKMLESGVRTARLRMKVAPPMPWLWDDLLNALEKHSVPCFMDFGDVTTVGNPSDSDIMGIRKIALSHPDLPLILSNVVGGLGIHYAIVPLVKRVPNIYIDITGILEFWREVAYEAGPEKVLFATGMPYTDPGIYVSNVQYARGLDEKAKKLICGGNLRRLLRSVR
jgi:predicted TIM-barrel fold metal-dependent hydrolase